MPTVSSCRSDLLVDDEMKRIGFIAAFLQISEYELFRIAYLKWYDRPISETSLDCLFKEYLETNEAPYWVNDFARKAHGKLLAGELNYKVYSITRRICDRRTRIKGWIIISSLFLLMFLYSYAISQYASY